MNYKVLEGPRVPLLLKNVEIDKKARKMALIGHLVGGEKVRKYLNQFALDGMETELMDLGNVASEHCSNAGTLITDLVQNREHLPIMLTNAAIQTSLSQGFRSHFLNPAFIGSRPTADMQNLHLGLQSHLIGSQWYNDFNRHLRLGQIRTDISSAEVLLRNADYIDIDLNVLRYSDNPGPRASTAGLTIEE